LAGFQAAGGTKADAARAERADRDIIRRRSEIGLAIVSSGPGATVSLASGGAG